MIRQGLQCGEPLLRYAAGQWGQISAQFVGFDWTEDQTDAMGGSDYSLIRQTRLVGRGLAKEVEEKYFCLHPRTLPRPASPVALLDGLAPVPSCADR
jgi:hypothetical protein